MVTTGINIGIGQKMVTNENIKKRLVKAVTVTVSLLTGQNMVHVKTRKVPEHVVNCRLIYIIIETRLFWPAIINFRI